MMSFNTGLSKSNGHFVAEYAPNLSFEKQQRHFVMRVCASIKGFSKTTGYFVGTDRI